MNLNALKKIRRLYENFNEIIKTYKRSTAGTLSSDEVKEVKETIEDLFILEIFSCLERFLRNQLLECLKFENCYLKSEKLLNHIEFMKTEELLDALKGLVDSNMVGYLKQIKQYRDWVAHGRNPQKPPPVKTVDFDEVFRIVEEIMSVLEKRNSN